VGWERTTPTADIVAAATKSTVPDEAKPMAPPTPHVTTAASEVA
jgi:hypothetical protein